MVSNKHATFLNSCKQWGQCKIVILRVEWMNGMHWVVLVHRNYLAKSFFLSTLVCFVGEVCTATSSNFFSHVFQNTADLRHPVPSAVLHVCQSTSSGFVSWIKVIFVNVTHHCLSFDVRASSAKKDFGRGVVASAWGIEFRCKALYQYFFVGVPTGSGILSVLCLHSGISWHVGMGKHEF